MRTLSLALRDLLRNRRRSLTTLLAMIIEVVLHQRQYADTVAYHP